MSGTDLAELKQARLLIAFTLRRKFCKCTTRGLQNPTGQRWLMQTRSRGIREGYSQMLCSLSVLGLASASSVAPRPVALDTGWGAFWTTSAQVGVGKFTVPLQGAWGQGIWAKCWPSARVGGGGGRPGKVGKRGGKAEGAAEKSK